MRATFSFSAPLIAASLVLGGCATPADKAAMTVDKQTVVAKKHPYSIGVAVGGGAETSAMGSSNISDADLKAAIETSIRQTEAFKEVVEGKSGQYLLTVAVVQLSKPSFGFSFTVEMETAWTLTRVGDGQVVFKKGISSAHTAGAGEAFAGVVRLRLAIEGAAKANIAQGLKAIGELGL